MNESPNLENPNQNEEPPVIPGNVPNNEPSVPAWQQAIYEERQNRIRSETELREAREEVIRLRANNNQTPVDTLEQGDTFNNPEKLMTRIRAEISASVAPLNQFVGEFARKDRYFNLKARFKNQMSHEQLAIFAQAEPMMDSQFLNNPALQPDDATFHTVFQNVVGFISMNGGFRPTNNNNLPNNPPPNNNNNVIPPNVRPSGPPARNNTPAFDDSQFTENDRRIARENKMSLEEYAIMRDTPPHKAEDAWREILAKRKTAAGGR